MQTRFTPCNTISYACKHVLRLATRFCMRANTFYIVATTHSVVNMAITSLQQLIRRSIWPLHRCNNSFGGRNDRYIVAATDSVGRMGFYIVATTHSVVRTGFLKGLRGGKDHFHVFGTHAVQQSAHLLLGILLCELQVLA